MSRLVVAVAGAIALAGCIRFAPPEVLSVTGPVVEAELADVTGDGTADVLIGTASGLARYEYCGAGCLEAAETLPGERPTGLVADFDNDGIEDVISRSGASTKILFGSPTGLSSAASVPIPSATDLGDFDGDGNVDLVESYGLGFYFTGYRALLGDGEGGFTASSLRAATGPLNASPDRFEVADVDGDGRDEFVSTAGADTRVTRLGGADCSAQPPGLPITCEAFSIPGNAEFVLGDIDGDGRADLARKNYDTRTIEFLRSTGNGFTPFPPFQTFTLPAETVYSSTFGLRDVDGDAQIDFLLDDKVNPKTWWSGTNDGAFPQPATSALPLRAAGCEPCFGDVNADGLPDVLLLDELPGTGVAIWINRAF